MLFDFRCVSGEQQFARDLRAWVFDQMEDYPLFFLHFAQNALLYKPPLSILGHIQTTSSSDGAKTLSLKEAVMPIVNFAALRSTKPHRLPNTLDRAQNYVIGCPQPQVVRPDVPRLRSLMRIRLRRQAIAIEEGKPRATHHPEELTSAEDQAEETLLRLRRPALKISYDFLGGIAVSRATRSD
jgi:signal-transduction protein with cAMP-binding, CBS, and nucleotidyltransferase domain